MISKILSIWNELPCGKTFGLPHDPQWDTLEMVGKEAREYMKRIKK
ncbi:MAG: hypothetical protein HYV34_03240 [Candidatus Kerfeldbacteria bacterium]|nr:hypothetical protein [Candidatus Kerfeldbacteria bacterium]